jgi:hypothetical protein
MKQSPRHHITLRRSRWAAAWFIAPAAATGALLWTLPWSCWTLLLADLALAAWAFWAWKRLMPRGLPGGVKALTLMADRQLRLYFVDDFAGGSAQESAANPPLQEEGLPAKVLDSTCLGDAFLTLVWRSEKNSEKSNEKMLRWRRRQRPKTLLLLPDMMPTEDWRRLRILLQHGREDDAGG